MKAIGRTQSLVIAGVLVVAVMAVGWLGLVKPAKSGVADLKAQATAQESTNSSLRLQLSVLQNLAKQLPQQQAELAAIKTKVPNQAQLANLLRQLVTSAKDTGVTLTGLTPTQPVDLTGAPGIKYVDLVITFTGGYAEIEQFDSALESLSRTLLVKDFTLSSGATAAAGSTTGVTSSSSSSSSTISATFNGRVLVQGATATATPTAAASTTPAHS